MAFILIIVVMLSLLAGATYYLSHKFYSGLASFFPSIKFWPVLLLFCIITLLIVLGFAKGFLPFSKDAKHIIGIIGNCCMGVLIYLLMFTIFADLIFIIPKLFKLSFTAHRLFRGIVAISVLFASCITCIYGFINARQIDHVSYKINLQKKNISNLNVVMISDLHLGAVGSESKLETIVTEINTLKPDIICIAGDFFDTDFGAIKDPDSALKILLKLNSKYGTYACLGNHDAGKSHTQMTDFLKQANINLLNDDYVVIDNRFVLLGRLDSSPIGGYNENKRKELSDFFKNPDHNLPVIVIDHNPAKIDEYDNNFDLILCGHTHKGQLFPANLITNAMYTVDYGYYQKDANSPHVVVSSGVGYWGMPMRVGTNCEIVSIQLCSN